MVALIGSILGFVGGFIPNILKYFQQKQDYAHEIEIMKLQMEAQAQLHTERLEEINTEADVKESEALYNSAKIEKTGVGWADAVLALYNGTVRPTITYIFTLLYTAVKLGQIVSFVEEGSTVLNAIEATYTETDMACLMLVLSYWFGQRMSTKVFKLK